MRNLFFPTTIIDGFFENPDSVRKIGLDQEYTHHDYNMYPGLRSRRINDINQPLFDSINLKFMDLYFKRVELSFSTSMSFQIVGKEMGSGWVHRDNSIATGIIYLTPNVEDCSIGTSLYDKKDILFDPMLIGENQNHKTDSFKNRKENVAARNKNNNAYKEVLNISGLYNRAVLFDSHLYHAAHNFIGDSVDENRLTIIVFFQSINCGSQLFPIPRIHQNAVTII